MSVKTKKSPLGTPWTTPTSDFKKVGYIKLLGTSLCLTQRCREATLHPLGKTRNYTHPCPLPHLVQLQSVTESSHLEETGIWSPSCTEVNLTISSQCFSGSWTSSGFFTTKEMVSIFLKSDLSSGDWTAWASTPFTVHQTTIAPPVSGGPTEGSMWCCRPLLGQAQWAKAQPIAAVTGIPSHS